MGATSDHTRGGKRRIGELQDKGPHRPSVMVATVHGMPKTTTSLHFPQLVWLRVDDGCYMKTCLATLKGEKNPKQSTLEIP